MTERAGRGRVGAVNVSARKGEKKVPVESVRLVEGYGIQGDAHGGTSGHRQVSLLSEESVSRMRAKGISVGPGDFAENITVEGCSLTEAHVGRRIRVGETILEVTQVGKECHDRCAIYVQVGDCVMPREGIFARVVVGGTVAPGDEVELLPPEGEGAPRP
jgi:MOSC domain-containing protein YiiM